MKLRALIPLITLFITSLAAPANAFVKPVVESFKVLPAEIELTGSSTRVSFELIAFHPFGIENTKSDVTIKSAKGDSLIASLVRTDSPIDYKKSRVVFTGSIEVPREMLPGVYRFTATSLRNNSNAGYQYETGTIESTNFRNLVGAENALLLRSYGNLDFSYETFVGPSYDVNLRNNFIDVIKYNSDKKPIFKVGEEFNPTDFFELRVPSLSLTVTSTTPNVCTSNGKNLKFIAIGNCSFSVSTPKTTDYLEKKISLSASITAARIKPSITLEKIPNQMATGLPKTISIAPVIGPTGSYILPKSETPTICTASLLFVRITSGGTCTISYQTIETSDFRASDIALQTFEVIRSAQSLDFALPTSIQLKSKSIALSAVASSDALVTFSAEPFSNCKVTGDTLTLIRRGNCSVTASQAGNATIAPISKTVEISIVGKAKRTISCLKGTKKIEVRGTNPKCAKGYSRVR